VTIYVQFKFMQWYQFGILIPHKNANILRDHPMNINV
jgi:hypothetical protein